MSQLSSDLLYKDLKQKGLELTRASRVRVPESQQIKNNLLKRISVLVPRNKQEDSTQANVMQIGNSFFMAIRGSAAFMYKYTLQGEEPIHVQLISKLYFNHPISRVVTCQSKFLQEKDVPLLFESRSKSIDYYNYDIKEEKFYHRTNLKVPIPLLSAWITDKECLLLYQDSIHHYCLVNETLKLKQTISTSLHLDSFERIVNCWIFSRIQQQQESVINIFYTTVPLFDFESKSKFLAMKLKIKELTRTIENDVVLGEQCDFVVETQSLQYKDTFQITSVGEYFCLKDHSEILVLKKRFGKYMLLDNMTQLMPGFELRLNRKGLVISIGEKLMELSCISFADPKCSSRICDVIQFSEDMQGKHKSFKQAWPVTYNQELTLVFVFIQGHQILLTTLIKMQPMQKMLKLAKSYPKDKLQIVEDMALNLGIPKHEFYLKLWSTSGKTNNDIYQYLIPCNDVHLIKRQLTAVLRIRTIQVSEMLKILDKISEINIKNLQKNLNQKNLQEFLKTDFLKKKVKLHEMNTLLDFRSFNQIYKKSLLKIFYDIITKQLDPVQIKTDPLHSDLNQNTTKQLNSLENVFQEFKVILLSDYKNFLRQLLQLKPNKILQIIEKFNFLLPNHPFEIEVQKPSKTNEPVIANPKPNNTPQEVWFESVTISEWKAQMTKQRIYNLLMNDYPTSKITETIDQFYNSTYGQENALKKHGLIVLGLQQYRNKIKSLGGLELYFNVCQLANQVEVARIGGDPQISDKINNILHEKNMLNQPDLHFCKLYTSMHYFMLKNNIVPKKKKLNIQTLIGLNPENLIALFFLQNRQRKQHIFNDFQQLYTKKQQFKQVLGKYVQSQNCSRIELQILMNQMISKGHRFQQQNQDLIDLLISGICMKIQIRESLVILDSDDQDQYNVGCLIDHIKLNKELALKVNRAKQLKKCKHIFKAFKLSKMSYHQLLNKEDDYEIFKLILSKFFELRAEHQQNFDLQVYIEGQFLSLSNPHNMLAVLLYLHETVYYSAQTFQILIIFCEQLIMWKQFQTVREVLNDQASLAKLGISRKYLMQKVLTNAIQQIYCDPDAYIEQSTQEQIISILSIDLVDILTNWGRGEHRWL